MKQHIANVRLVTDLITSKFGDQRLFFQHETMKFDFEYDNTWRHQHEKVEPAPVDEVTGERPEVSYDFPEDNAEAMAVVRGSIADYGCPFAWMIEGLVVNPIY